MYLHIYSTRNYVRKKSLRNGPTHHNYCYENSNFIIAAAKLSIHCVKQNHPFFLNDDECDVRTIER